ncbi:hypothetical protein BLNAU_12031 [Blattamonas nauphoetae]|uniref:Uncharacterized protein n=1 Tax=Blattamonas nauphoetae TaxID=2049346 RepID=A0ABQ9XNT0_9EUKA|nr:hypothetical protein BLNAU_12031 [Blattamonas nauphoetae]
MSLFRDVDGHNKETSVILTKIHFETHESTPSLSFTLDDPLIVCSAVCSCSATYSTGTPLSPAVLAVTRQHRCMESAKATMSCASGPNASDCGDDVASRDGGCFGVQSVC